MVEFIYVGIVVLLVVIFVCFYKHDVGKGIAIMCGIMLVSVGFLETAEKVGAAKAKIERGEYSIVTMTTTQEGNDSVLNMLLKKDGKIRYYVFPEDMVIKKKSGAPSSVEVVEKGDLKKIILR